MEAPPRQLSLQFATQKPGPVVMNSSKLMPPILEIKEECAENWKISEYFCDTIKNVFADQDIVALDHDYIKHTAAQLFGEINKENVENYGKRKRHSRRGPLICGKCNKEFLLPINFKIHMETHGNDEFPESEPEDAVLVTEETEKDDPDVDIGDTIKIDSSSEPDNGSEDFEQENIEQLPTEYKVPRSFSPAKVKRKHRRGNEIRTCPICKKELHRRSMSIHMRIHNGTKSFSCYLCGKRFTQKPPSIRHMVVHASDTAEKGFSECEICGKFYPTICLKIHMKIHDKKSTSAPPVQEQMSCEICGMTLSSKSNLNAHVRLHMDVKRHECEVCGKKFLFKSSMRKHMPSHIKKNEISFPCKLCGRKLSTKSILARHMKLVHSEKLAKENLTKYYLKQHSCSVCTRRFLSPSAVLDHFVTAHTKERSHICPVCHKSFALQRRLKYHMGTHNEEKKSHCKVCGKGFLIKKDLERHLRVHTGEKPFTCKVCGLKFKVKQNMLTHWRNHAEIDSSED